MTATTPHGREPVSEDPLRGLESMLTMKKGLHGLPDTLRWRDQPRFEIKPLSDSSVYVAVSYFPVARDFFAGPHHLMPGQTATDFAASAEEMLKRYGCRQKTGLDTVWEWVTAPRDWIRRNFYD